MHDQAVSPFVVGEDLSLCLDIEALALDPGLVATTLQLVGEIYDIRLLAGDDAGRLSAYFKSLSVQTRRFFAPHAFTPAVAQQLCRDLLSKQTVRLVAADHRNGGKLVAYFILHLGIRVQEKKRFEAYGIPLDERTDCIMAPSVTDRCQGCGIGRLMMDSMVDLARRTGRTRILLLGGVDADNSQAVAYYRQGGFRTVAAFSKPRRKYDMLMDLDRNQVESC